MCDVAGALPLAARRELLASLLETIDPFVLAVPKVELHVHIEGIITPELKWKFARRNGIQLMHPRTGKPFSTLEEYRDSHDPMKNRDGKLMDNSEETISFFDAYYGGFAVLKTEQDYFDLAMYYFEHAAAMNVRYCEIFFDPQGHTRFGVEWKTMMSGFDQAQKKAERDLHVSFEW
jgi:adenosine deaminase